MSLKDALGFESFNIGNFFKNLKHDPKRIFLGVDPLSTKAWNTVLGRNDKPLVNQLGGPTSQTYKDANAKGISTGTASTLHGIASVIAGAEGGAGAFNGLGNAAGSLGGGGGTTGGTVGGATGTGGGAAVAGGASEAIPEVVISGSSGGGLGTAGAAGAGAGGATASNSNGNSWRDQLQQQGMPGQQQNAGDEYAAQQRRQMEQMIEQERLRRESFRRNAIARTMLS